MRFGVLLVAPTDFEVGALFVIGSSLCANLVDGKSQRDVSVEFIAFVVAESGFDAPTASSVDVAQNLQVIVVVNCPIIASILEVETSVGRLAVGRDDDARFLSFCVRNHGKGQGQRQRDV